MELFALAWALLTSPLLLLSTIIGTLTVYVLDPPIPPGNDQTNTTPRSLP